MASPIRRAGRLKKADPSTIQNKFMVGYQGWFTCAGDGPPLNPGHHGWLHWFNAPITTDGGRPTIDLWPDVSSYTPSELYPAPGLSIPSPSSQQQQQQNQNTSTSTAPGTGTPANLFSSRNPTSVRRHFHWMAQHGVSGAFLQRFAGQCEVDGGRGGKGAIMALRDEIGRYVRRAAEDEGRVWAVMYDASGVPADRLVHTLTTDWAHLLSDERVLESPNYLHEQGKPVLALWGLGFDGRGHSPAVVRTVVRKLRAMTPGGDLYVMAGAPAHWRSSHGDADPDPGFLDVWLNEFDAISPWSVGRYSSEEAADRFARENIRKDMQLLHDGMRQRRGAGEMSARKVDYVPVVFPGFSGINLSQGKWGFNQIPRNGGRFLWRQVYNVMKEGAGIVYGAMWDEYDEGTAFMPVVPYKRQLPQPGRFLALDEDGYDLPSDWYMRITGFASEILHGERKLQEPFPVKELQDYWSAHPKYDFDDFEPGPSSGTGSGSGSSALGSGSGAGYGLGSASASGSGSGAGADAGSSSGSGSGLGATGAGANDTTGQREEGGGVSQSFTEWLANEKEDKDEAPPPPYSLEAEETEKIVDEATLSNVDTATTTAGSNTNTNTNVNAHTVTQSQNLTQQTVPAGTTNPLPQSQPQLQTHATNLAPRPSSIASTTGAQSAGSGVGSATYTPPSRVSSLTAATAARPASVQSQVQSQSQSGYNGPSVSGLGGQSQAPRPTSTPPVALGTSMYPGQDQQTPSVGHQEQGGASLGRYGTYHGSPSPASGVDSLANDFSRQSLSDGVAMSPPHSHQQPATSHSPYLPHAPVLGAAAASAVPSPSTTATATAHGQFSPPAPHAEAHLHSQQTQVQTQSAGYHHSSGLPVQWPPAEWGPPDNGLGAGAGRRPTRPPPPPQHPSRPPRPSHSPNPGSSGNAYPNAYRPAVPPSPGPAPDAAYQAPPPQPQQPWAAFPQPNTVSSQFAGNAPYTAHMPTPPPRSSSLEPGGFGAGVGMPSFPGAGAYHQPASGYPSGGSVNETHQNHGARPGFVGEQFPESQGSTSTSTAPGYPPVSSPWSGPNANLAPPRISNAAPPSPPGSGPTMPMPRPISPNVLPGRLGDVASGAFGFAMGAVDRFAGENTRKRLETGVDQLAATGSKLYQKFRK